MSARKEFNEVLGRIITNRAFGDKVLGKPKEGEVPLGVQLSAQELAQLRKLTIAVITPIRSTLGV
jgi:hypothetical protein